MNEQISYTNAVFMEVTRNKIEGQDKELLLLKKKINNVPNYTEPIQGLIGSIEGLRSELKNNTLSPQKVEELTASVDRSISIYKELVKNKIVHHHHVSKLVWISAGLFIAFALVCAGWYSTSNKLDGFTANDTKYRQLRLDTANRELQSYLDLTDSLYSLDPNVRCIVIKIEEKNRKNFERLQKAERLKAEAEELEKTVKKK